MAPVVSHYCLHGIPLVVTSNEPSVLWALDGRLRSHRGQAGDGPQLTFGFARGRAVGDPSTDRPTEPMRPVYERPGTQVLYSDATDALHISYRDRVQVLCYPRQGTCQVGLAAPSDSWVASHSMFTVPLMEMLKRRGLYPIHAAGLCTDSRCIVFPGTTGSGKSTLAIALLRAGFGFMGDDTLFLRPMPDGQRVLAFADEIDVTDDTAAMFQELRFLLRVPRTPGAPKRAIRAEEVYGAEPVWEARPAAIVFPELAQVQRSFIEPMDHTEALIRLAPDILLTDQQSSQAHLGALAALVDGCKRYRLHTGRDLDALPALLQDLAA